MPSQSLSILSVAYSAFKGILPVFWVRTGDYAGAGPACATIGPDVDAERGPAAGMDLTWPVNARRPYRHIWALHIALDAAGRSRPFRRW